MGEKISLQYIAGFFDGEGGIYVTQKIDKRFGKGILVRNTRCQIANTHKGVLMKIQKMYGGTIRLKNHRRGFTWEIASQKDILKFLQDIEPYLIVKKRQVKLAIQYLKFRLSHQHKKYTNEEIKLVEKIRMMTKRGQDLKKKYPKWY